VSSSDALSASESSAEDLYENAPCGYLSASPDGTIVRVNGTFLRWTGYRREQLVGVRRFQELLSPGGRIYHETHYAPLLRMQGSVREIAVEIVAADGQRLPVLVNSVLVLDEAGEPQIVRTTVLDARERKAYERELRAARDRERLARENIERLQEQTQAISHTLQQSLLASDPPSDARLSIATLYQPAGGEQLEVGGDWHDAFKLEGDRVGVVVGDVVGRGLAAATAMGQLRSAVRALAGTGVGPRAVVGHLDTFVAQVDAAQFATLIYAEIDPGSGEVTMAAAGHLPPVIVTPRGAELFLGGRSTPLGVRTSAAPRAEATFVLEPGDRLVLYTDGLVERRRESIDAGLDRLLAAVTVSTAPEALARALEEDGRGDDDVCVLVFSRLE
jgi:sigma-B regulation protein RsbU (phosphoserine phosphatase)